MWLTDACKNVTDLVDAVARLCFFVVTDVTYYKKPLQAQHGGKKMQIV